MGLIGKAGLDAFFFTFSYVFIVLFIVSMPTSHENEATGSSACENHNLQI